METNYFLLGYPDLSDPDFEQKIFERKEFRLEGMNIDTETSVTSRRGRLPHQQFVERFLSPHTPYRRLFLYWDMGTGKSCGAGKVCEQWKHIFSRPALIVLGSEQLHHTFAKQIPLCAEPGEYIREADEQDFTRIPRSVTRRYEFSTHTKIMNQIQQANDRNVVYRYFDNRVVVIDEAHHFHATSKKEVSNRKYKALNDAIRNSKNNVVIIMTGTPMYNTADQFAQIINLILPTDIPPITQENYQLIGNMVRGYISYFKKRGIPDVVDVGDVFDKIPNFKFISCKMRDDQKKIYHIAYKNYQDADIVLKQISDIVYPGYQKGENIEPYYGSEGFRSVFHVTSAGIKVVNTFKFNELMKNIGKYSCKYQAIINILTKLKNKKDFDPIFIYCEQVETGGSLPLFMILQRVFGSEAHRIKIISSYTGQNEKKKIITRYNSPENEKGNLIWILVSSGILGEGYSFHHTRRVFVLSPWWNDSRTSQAISRALRIISLKSRKPEDRYVLVYRFMALYRSSKYESSIDYKMYRVSSEKNKRKKEVISEIIEKNAVDCFLYTGVETCENVEQTNNVNLNTFDQYYYSSAMAQVVQSSRFLSNSYPVISPEDVFQFSGEIGTFISSIRCMNSLVSQRFAFRNRLGLINYMNYDWKNGFYVTDDFVGNLETVLDLDTSQILDDSKTLDAVLEDASNAFIWQFKEAKTRDEVKSALERMPAMLKVMFVEEAIRTKYNQDRIEKARQVAQQRKSKTLGLKEVREMEEQLGKLNEKVKWVYDLNRYEIYHDTDNDKYYHKIAGKFKMLDPSSMEFVSAPAMNQRYIITKYGESKYKMGSVSMNPDRGDQFKLTDTQFLNLEGEGKKGKQGLYITKSAICTQPSWKRIQWLISTLYKLNFDVLSEIQKMGIEMNETKIKERGLEILRGYTDYENYLTEIRKRNIMEQNEYNKFLLFHVFCAFLLNIMNVKYGGSAQQNACRLIRETLERNASSEESN